MKMILLVDQETVCCADQLLTPQIAGCLLQEESSAALVHLIRAVAAGAPEVELSFHVFLPLLASGSVSNETVTNDPTPAITIDELDDYNRNFCFGILRLSEEHGARSIPGMRNVSRIFLPEEPHVAYFQNAVSTRANVFRHF